MKGFWRGLEYGARVGGAVLVAGGLGLIGVTVVAALFGPPTAEPFVIAMTEWIIGVAPVPMGVWVWELGGVFKRMAEKG